MTIIEPNKVPVVGVAHPGHMGAAPSAALKAAGFKVQWASEGRSDEALRKEWEIDDPGVSRGDELVGPWVSTFSI